MRLVLDQMLKKSARWLRIFGIDTLYFEGKKDEELLKIALREKAVLITPDTLLHKTALKKNVKSVLLNSTDFEEQLLQLKKELNIKFPFPGNTRCPLCNIILEEIDREKVKEKVPAKVFEGNKDFWGCSNCNKIYWRVGRHWKRIEELFHRIEKEHGL